jgi:hypothetical protein
MHPSSCALPAPSLARWCTQLPGSSPRSSPPASVPPQHVGPVQIAVSCTMLRLILRAAAQSSSAPLGSALALPPASLPTIVCALVRQIQQQEQHHQQQAFKVPSFRSVSFKTSCDIVVLDTPAINSNPEPKENPARGWQYRECMRRKCAVLFCFMPDSQEG